MVSREHTDEAECSELACADIICSFNFQIA